MPTTEKYLLGTIQTLLSTGLNSLGSNSLALGSAWDNTQGGGSGDGYTLCEVELVVTFSTAPAANTGIPVWFLGQPDGTNFEDGGTSTTPGRSYDVIFPLLAVTTQQRIVRRTLLPPGLLKPLLKNDGTGQSFASSGNTLKVRPVARQGV